MLGSLAQLRNYSELLLRSLPSFPMAPAASERPLGREIER